jgi:uncharacterized Zn finger protein
MAPPPKYVPVRASQRMAAKPAASTMHPRKVRNGVRIPAGEVAGPSAWTAQRVLKVLESSAGERARAEGLEYARQGQIVRWSVGSGVVEGVVQGRATHPYSVRILSEALAAETLEGVCHRLAESPTLSARLLSGEVPLAAEEVFVERGGELLAEEPGAWRAGCTCGSMDAHAPADAPWCKHAAALAYLFAHTLAKEPITVFTFRGMAGAEVLERLRHRRTVAGNASGASTVYTQTVPGVTDVNYPSLEADPGSFWRAPGAPDAFELDLPVEPPPLSHPLLRRLGASPWSANEASGAGAAKFPLVGLLASCYDAMSAHALELLRRAEEAAQHPQPPTPTTEEEAEDPGEGLG